MESSYQDQAQFELALSSDQEQTELKNIDSQQLKRVSAKAKDVLSDLKPCVDKQVDYQENLHLEVQVEEARDLIFQCNLELTDFIADHRRQSSRQPSEKQVEQKTQNRQTQTQNSESPEQKQKRKWHEQLTNTLENYKKTFTLRQVQLTMVLFISEHRQLKNFKELYIKNYGSLSSYIIPVQLTSRPLNMTMLSDVFKKEAQFLQTYRDSIVQLKRHSSLDSRLDIDYIIGRMKVSHAKIKTIGEIFPWACIKDKDDLFSQSPLSPRWQRLTATGQIKYVNIADKHSLSLCFEDIKKGITMVNAAMSILDRHKVTQKQTLTQKASDVMNTAMKVVRVALFKNQAQYQATVMMAQPQQALAKEIWNLPQSKRFRDFIKLSLPSIEYSELFYLPRKLQKYFDERFYQKKQPEFPMLHVKDVKQYQQNLLKKIPYDVSIRVRVNSPYQLAPRLSNQPKQAQAAKQADNTGLLNSLTKMFQKETRVPKAIIFHIHGGGFVSMSSFIHQTYTRRWAKNLEVPIISVDYGKAPEHPYPRGLYDSFEAYMWTLMVFKQVFDIYPQKIIFVGDSAGGNIVAALTTLLLQWNLPGPAGLVLVYPALSLNFLDYTPSLLTALNDMILPHTFLKICQKAYIKDPQFNPATDPLISPIVTPKEILANFPKTQIIVGNKDPFHDDCCRLVEKMNQVKQNNARLTILEEFPHGFLQFDVKLLPNAFAKEATKLVEDALKDHLSV